MLSLLRKIRHDLLSNKKAGSYLLYAIGEIVLIVIGILLAVSISNWNEERKTNAKEDYYLLKLASNLNDDIINFNQVIDYEKSVGGHLDSILIIIRNPNAFESADLRRHNSSLFAFKRFYTNKTAFENLVSSGQMDIIKNQVLVEKLFLYYRDLDEQAISGDAALASYSRNNVGPFFMEFDFLFGTKQAKSAARKARSLLEYHTEPRADNLVTFKLSLIASQIRSYETLIERAQEMAGIVRAEQQ